MKNLIYLLCIGFSILSCERTIEFDGETKKPKLVINSTFNSVDTFKINLSNSLAVIDNGDLKYINDAEVKLYDEKDDLLGFLENKQKGTFVLSDKALEVGKSYKVTVEKEGYTSITASDIIPGQPTILKVDTLRMQGREGEKHLGFELSLKDPKGKHFYMIEFWMSIDEEMGGVGSQLLYFSSRDPNIFGYTSTDNQGWSGNQLILTDNAFEGQEYKLNLRTDTYPFDAEFVENVELRVSSISEATYSYYTSLQIYQENEFNPFSNPVQVYSNVENGFGIFGGAAVWRKDLK